MNYLAHTFLSGDNPDVQIGNFIGDAIKGKDFQNYPPNILKGILLHRQIDSFTDIHPIVHRSKKRLDVRYGHYTGVLIDIAYDYFLSRNWSVYSKRPLVEFIDDFYTTLKKCQVELPAEIQNIIPKIIENDWFSNYTSIDGLTRVFKVMEKRIIHDIPLSKSIIDIQDNYTLLEDDFNEFFPLLQKHVHQVLQTLNEQYD